jgi:hypothetical protein
LTLSGASGASSPPLAIMKTTGDMTQILATPVTTLSQAEFDALVPSIGPQGIPLPPAVRCAQGWGHPLRRPGRCPLRPRRLLAHQSRPQVLRRPLQCRAKAVGSPLRPRHGAVHDAVVCWHHQHLLLPGSATRKCDGAHSVSCDSVGCGVEAPPRPVRRR